MQLDGHQDARARILYLLKTKGPQTASQLAKRLAMTATGARQHLELLAGQKLVEFAAERRPVGRPVRLWRLTSRGDARFPEGYAELALDFLQAARQSFGAAGLERLLRTRARRQLRDYRRRLGAVSGGLAQKVAALARIRSAEGYMAEWRREADGSVSLIENHCPIGAAAQACPGLCGAELELFRAALGAGSAVERSEHLLDGARRCVYRIREQA